MFGGKKKAKPYRYFFATDVHGSDRCFRKFLAAARAYEADALILGGDIAGKAIVPVASNGDGKFRFSFHGVDEAVTEEELPAALEKIRFNGLYPRVSSAAEIERMGRDEAYLNELFEQVIAEQVAGWCELAAERLPDDMPLVITPGNDDPEVIDAVLARADRVQFTELEVAEVGPAWLASLGNTNPTPWHTDREYTESELTTQIEDMLAEYGDGRPLMFNFHCPPYETGLDTVAKLDDDFRPVIEYGAPVEVPVGSTAVRDAVEKYQPSVALHGHIHECQGAHRIGESVCLNPGSDYSSGVLKGVIVDLAPDGTYRHHLFTNG